MEDLPDGFGEADLVAALRAFGVAAEQVAYAPVGFGDYHWTVLDTGGRAVVRHGVGPGAQGARAAGAEAGHGDRGGAARA
ncbi:hypothetical protein ACFSTC_28310 [Nonomuraea ferruginea]